MLGSGPFKSPFGLKIISVEDLLNPKEDKSLWVSDRMIRKLASFALFNVFSIPIFSILFLDFLIPAVSRKTIGIPSRL